MNQTNGYNYIRNHPSYDVNDVCKMGKVNNIPERDTQYATGEIKRGYFEAVFEVSIKKKWELLNVYYKMSFVN